MAELIIPPNHPPPSTTPNTCYVVIRTHGMIEWDTIIPIPTGKEIIKKNKAACGYATLGEDSYMFETELLIPYVNEMRTNLTCMVPTTIGFPPPVDEPGEFEHTTPGYIRSIYQTYVEEHPEDGVPSMENTNAELCQVMVGKTQYYNKQYQTIDADGFDNKHLYGGIFVFIWNSRSYDIFNIMDPKVLNKLLLKYYVSLDPSHSSPQLVDLLNSIKDKPIIRQSSITHFDFMDTLFLFKLFSVLPFNTFKILDLSCAVGEDFMDPRRLQFNYRGHLGYGRRRSFKKHKKYTKKQLQKYIKINRIKNTQFRKKGITKNIGI